MDNLKLPVRDIESKYTLSELAIMGWHSRLQSYNMSKRFASKPSAKSQDTKGRTIEVSRYDNPNNVRDLGDAWQLPQNVNNGVPIPKKFFDDEGNMDLRKATGPEALAYLRKIGINITIPVST